MANIKEYTDQIAQAIYGEEVRGSIIGALEKVNDDNDSYAALKAEVQTMHDTVVADTATVESAVSSIGTSVEDCQEYAESAAASIATVQGYRNESEIFRNQAEQYAKEAEAAAHVEIATTSKAGIVKPDGTTITVDSDGTIHSTATGGVSDYDDLDNRPSINGHVLTGNQTAADLNIPIITVDSAMSSTSTNPVQNKVIYEEINTLKNSVSDGKTLVANAITEKGVATESTDTFSTMADNILAIESGKKSLVLPTNPTISVEESDSSLTLTWETPESEVAIDYYNIYYSLTSPTSLLDMTKVGETSSNTYTITGLTNGTTYYVAVESVDTDGYENASIWKVEDGVPSAVRFVAVGNGGVSAYSTDGKTWVTMSKLDSGAYDIFGVAYGQGKFVCCCTGAVWYISTDGQTWSQRVDESGGYFRDIAYGNGVFVTIESSTRNHYYSTNGTTWTAISSLPASSILVGIAYGNGRFVTVGNNGVSYYSTDGINWVAMSGLATGSNYYYGVAYGNGRFVCVGNKGNTYYSTDGTSWSALSGLSTSYPFYGIAYGMNHFICVGGSGVGYYLADGSTTWSALPTPDSKTANSITFAKDRFVRVGGSGSSYYSTDGYNWNSMSGLDTNFEYRSVTSNATN